MNCFADSAIVFNAIKFRSSQTLAKALFNLLITKDTRQLMVNQGIMSSLIRLAKDVNTSEVISLCVTAIQNLTCELAQRSLAAGSLVGRSERRLGQRLNRRGE